MQQNKNKSFHNSIVRAGQFIANKEVFHQPAKFKKKKFEG